MCTALVLHALPAPAMKKPAAASVTKGLKKKSSLSIDRSDVLKRAIHVGKTAPQEVLSYELSGGHICGNGDLEFKFCLEITDKQFVYEGQSTDKAIYPVIFSGEMLREERVDPDESSVIPQSGLAKRLDAFETDIVKHVEHVLKQGTAMKTKGTEEEELQQVRGVFAMFRARCKTTSTSAGQHFFLERRSYGTSEKVGDSDDDLDSFDEDIVDENEGHDAAQSDTGKKCDPMLTDYDGHQRQTICLVTELGYGTAQGKGARLRFLMTGDCSWSC